MILQEELHYGQENILKKLKQKIIRVKQIGYQKTI